MQRSRPLAGLALLALAPLAAAVPDESGALVDPNAAASGVAEDAVMTARLNYNIGFERFENVRRLELTGGEPRGAAARTREAEVTRGLAEARERFRAAAIANPQMKEAWNMLGYTSRRLGDYEESLQAYERALALAPDYPEAIEYRAELFMLTGRFDEVRTAYARLQQSSPSYAAELKSALQAWAKQKDAPGSRAEGRDAFVAWIGTL